MHHALTPENRDVPPLFPLLPPCFLEDGVSLLEFLWLLFLFQEANLSPLHLESPPPGKEKDIFSGRWVERVKAELLFIY